MYRYKKEKGSILVLYSEHEVFEIIKVYKHTLRRSFRHLNTLSVEPVARVHSNTVCKRFLVYCHQLDLNNIFKNKKRIDDHIESIKFKEQRGTYRFKNRRSLINALYNLVHREDSAYYNSKLDVNSIRVKLTDVNKFIGVHLYRFDDSEPFFVKQYSNSHRFEKLLEVLK